MPITRSALLWGHVLTSVVANLVSLALVMLVARRWASAPAPECSPGSRSSGSGPLHAGPDLAGRDPRADREVGRRGERVLLPLIFLPFISAAFVPTEGMPGPVRWFAEHQPVTPIVNTLRNLYAGQPVGNDGWIALGWCVGLLAVAYALAIRTYRSKIA